MAKTLLIAAIILGISRITLAQKQEALPMQAIDTFIETQMRKQQIPGLSLAVVRDGKLLFTRGYGLADVELNAAATPETVYQIQSITKTFTASAIMMLLKEGKLSLDDPVSKYLDGTPDTWKDITIRRLLTHTSGIKDYINEPYANLRIETTDEEVLRETAKRPLNFQPGERYAYCNTGYLLLGMIIRKTSGDSYGEFLRKRIFEPLGMSNTRVVSWRDIIPKRASGYLLQDGKVARGEFIAESILSYPGGGLLSTVLDLAKYDAIWQSGQLLDESTIRQMWTTAQLNDGSRTGYGLGWGVGDLRGYRMIQHSGGHSTGFATKYALFPQRKLSVIVFTNQVNSSPDPIAQGIAGLVDEALTPPAMMKEKAESDPALLEKLVKAVIELSGDTKDDALLTPPLRRAITAETKSTLASPLPSVDAMKYLGSDDVTGKEIAAYGVISSQLRYYRMKNGDNHRYFKFYLTSDVRVAGLTLWDEK
jgi:D-alanyl-D-alanine carboxypeptidase